MNRLVDQQGASPPGVWTFAFLTENSSPLIWHGYNIGKDTVMIYSPGSPIEAQSRPGFEIFSLSFSEEGLCAIGEKVGFPGLSDLLKGAERLSCDRSQMQILRRHLTRFYLRAQKNPSMASIRRFWETLQFHVPCRLLETLGSSRAEGNIPPPRMREGAMKRALKIIEEMIDEPPTVQDLCRIAGASERLLRYAFLDRFGISPKAYLRAVQLNGVRRELRGADPSSTKIIDVANRWGFWHMGQFAADYRRLFGELPSETLGGPPQGLLENLMMVERGSRTPSHRFRVPPKGHLLGVRLNGVRQELQGGDPSLMKIYEVANRWGFWDMGQFAADYRRLFGELPAETLGKSPKGLLKNVAGFHSVPPFPIPGSQIRIGDGGGEAINPGCPKSGEN
jgi:AraC family ethanolamine operon transcriptional activator